MPDRLLRLAFVHYPGRIDRLAEARAGRAPTEFLFGAIELERQGHHVAHYEIDPDAPVGWLGSRVNRNAHLGRLPPHLGGAELAQTRRLLGELGAADVVVGSTTAAAMALAVWRRLGALRRPLVGIVAGLVNPAYGRPRRVTSVALLRVMDSVLYGEAELGPMLGLHPSLAGRVHVNQFGVDTGFWTPDSAADDGYVLAIGSDGRRDYETLVRAAPDIPAPVRVLTRLERPSTLPGNVTWELADWHRRVLSDEQVREVFRRAALVVVPLHDSLQPSGQSVTLQAMACGRPVLLTETRGLWSPSTLTDGENVLFMPERDPGALAAAAGRLLGSPDLRRDVGAAGRETVCRHATVDEYAARMATICRRALERAG